MNGVTIVWTLVAGVSLTLAIVHFAVWLQRRAAWSSAILTVMALGTAALAFAELSMMMARTPGDYGRALRLAHVPVWIVMVSMIAFMHVALTPRYRWIGWTVIGLRTVTLALNFSTGTSLNLGAVTELHTFRLLGEYVSVGKGPYNPWAILGNLSTLLMGLAAIDASLGAWRHGSRGPALRVGGTILFFALASVTQTILVFGMGVDMPTTIGLFALAVLLAMTYELSCEVTRASRLSTELQESEQRMTMAAEAANLGLWVRDLKRDHIWASPRLRELLGIGPDELVNYARLGLAVHPDDQAAMIETLARAKDGRAPAHFRHEFRCVMPDGRVRWLASQGRVEFDAAGHAARTRGACTDITAVRRAEAETMQLRQELAHIGRVSVVGQLGSALAHEINQPLGAILRNAEAAELLLKCPAPDLEEVRAIVDDILNDDRRAGAVIDRMRALLRRHEITMVPLSVQDFVGDVAALVRTDAMARHVKMEVALPPDIPPVMGDRIHLQQVLLNLLTNAMDAIDEARRTVRHVAVTAVRDGADFVQIAVTDSGTGIPADRLESIFGSFVTTKPSGMGMGLSIARGLIETHGGRLWAENDSGGGASLRFTLAVALKDNNP